MERIQVIIEKETQYGVYRDALYFLEDQMPLDEEIERMKQERVDNWIAVVTAPFLEDVLPPVEEALQDGE